MSTGKPFEFALKVPQANVCFSSKSSMRATLVKKLSKKI